MGHPATGPGIDSNASSLAVIELTLYEVSYLASGETVAFKIHGQLTAAVDDDGVE